MLVLAGAASALAPGAMPAEAAGAWRGSAQRAGAYEADGRAVLELACTGPGALSLSALGPGLPAGGRASLVLGIDGTAFLFEAAGDGAGRLAAPLAGAKAGLVVALLRRGKAAELRVPAGRYAVPLAGSGAALAPLQAGCALAPAG